MRGIHIIQHMLPLEPVNIVDIAELTQKTATIGTIMLIKNPYHESITDNTTWPMDKTEFDPDYWHKISKSRKDLLDEF
jgi:hypothetical protein